MGNVSRPLIALLLATVVFFALWLIALKPSSSSNGGNQPLGQYQSAVNAAKGVQSTVDKASAAAQGESAPTSSTGAAAPARSGAANTSSASASSKSVTATKTANGQTTKVTARSARVTRSSAPATPAARLAVVGRALNQRKVLALLFYNPAAPDDNAVKAELASISTHHGAVVKLEVPLSELPSYTVVINQVPVNFSPTLVIIDRTQQAQEITGYADSYEIEQRLQQAMTVGTVAR